jgi:hypothetical protein
MHTDAHFVLISSGNYVCSAIGDAHPQTCLIYNPPVTKRRNHFWQGKRSFFTVSLLSAQWYESLDTARSPSVAVRVRRERALELAWALLMVVRESTSQDLYPSSAQSLTARLYSN